MAETEKVYYPAVIDETPFPGQEKSDLTVTDPGNKTTQTYGPAETAPQELPRRKIAQALLSDQLNTQTRKILSEFQFTPSGAIQIGNYQTDDTGDIRISPNGIVARNKLGEMTFTLDGETGDATFAGTVQAGAIIAGAVAVGDKSIIIDGGNRSIIVNDGVTDRILIGYQKNGF